MKNFLYIILVIIFFPEVALSKISCPEGQDVCIVSVQKLLHRYNLIAINNTPHIASFYLDLETDNIKSSKAIPMQFTLKGRTKYTIVQLRVKDIGKQSNFSILYSWMHGNFMAKENNFAYKLPYQINKSFFVGQGFRSDKTHTGLNKYAIDWNMPVGTPIHAARSGYVIEVKEDSSLSGRTTDFLDKANYIKILHKDGSIGVYAHLKHNGVIAKKGKFIPQGSLIGYSGNTGYSTGPHLHFHVYKPYVYDGKIAELTIPFQFSNCNSQTNFIPKEGKEYTSC